MSFLSRDNIKNFNLYFLGLSIFPISVFAPVGMWIPLVLSSVVYFFLEKKKSVFFQLENPRSTLPLLLMIYLVLSLFWTQNISHAYIHLLHLIFLYIAFRIVLISTEKTKIKTNIKYVLFYSFIFCCFTTTIDIYFNLGIKLFFSNFFENLRSFNSSNNSLENTDLRSGMYSGLYNRGINVLLIFSCILSFIFLRQKIYLFIIILFCLFLIFTGESQTSKLLVFLFIFIFAAAKILKKFLSLLLISTVAFYFIFSPLLLNLNNIDKWGENHVSLMKKIDDNKSQTLLSLLNTGNLSDVFTYLENIKNKIHFKLLHRQMIWSFTANKIKEKPFHGHGLSSSRVLDKKVEVFIIENGVKTKKYFSLLPLHPHNHVLQIWLELGLIGIILFISIYFTLWKDLIKRLGQNSQTNVVLICAFFGVFLINQLSYGLWQTWWLASIGYFIIFINLFLKKVN